MTRPSVFLHPWSGSFLLNKDDWVITLPLLIIWAHITSLIAAFYTGSLPTWAWWLWFIDGYTHAHIRVQQDVNMCCRCEVCGVVWHWDPGMCPTDSFRPDREGLWCSCHSRRLLFTKYGWQVKMLWLKLYLCVWNWGGVCHTFFSFFFFFFFLTFVNLSEKS